MIPRAKQVLELHDAGESTDAIMRKVGLPWYIVCQILKGHERAVRPAKVAKERGTYGR